MITHQVSYPYHVSISSGFSNAPPLWIPHDSPDDLDNQAIHEIHEPYGAHGLEDNHNEKERIRTQTSQMYDRTKQQERAHKERAHQERRAHQDRRHGFEDTMYS